VLPRSVTSAHERLDSPTNGGVIVLAPGEKRQRARRVKAIAAAEKTAGQPVALWSLAFRPFFLAAAFWAALALALWMVVFFTGAALPTRFDPLTWRIHAMLFGFVLAAIGGFMLTAIPNWTGRPPIRGAAPAWLLTLWLLGRIACLISVLVPFWLAGGLDLAFPVALCTVAAREIVAARNWRNLMMLLPIGVLAIANLLTYLELAQFSLPAGLGWRLRPSERWGSSGSSKRASCPALSRLA
jgi:uncharacterized protein involved in response to NO